LPWVFEEGFAQLIVNGGADCARVKSRIVGCPPDGVPLNASTQALTVFGPAAALAVPSPILAWPHCAIAWDIVMVPEMLVGSHFGIPLVSILKSSSK